jgi:hypothetical protein
MGSDMVIGAAGAAVIVTFAVAGFAAPGHAL